MQMVKNKKVWLFLVLGVAVLTVFCFMTSGKKQKKTYMNGRIVENEQQGENTIEICWGEEK
ncbi:MAG: hypothetical protein SO170_02395 [Butyribacter sp.]|nr:hypothetical protein [bacterium]MDY3853804.1 hypothetical protein [Butyribacter sp.]